MFSRALGYPFTWTKQGVGRRLLKSLNLNSIVNLQWLKLNNESSFLSSKYSNRTESISTRSQYNLSVSTDQAIPETSL